VGGRITLADARGPFGNPSSDSARTMVIEAARRVLMIVFAPADLPMTRLAHVLAASSARTLVYCGGAETLRRIV
jgi:DNA/RNA-binding domain of Phe-tRNA-synthetase-like protein